MLICYAEIGEQLLVMYRLYLLHGFKFYNHCIFYEDIKTKVYWQYLTIVDNVKLHLILYMQSLLPQFIT